VVDVDQQFGESFRVVQLTPRGSGCSITIGTGLSSAAPGSVQGMWTDGKGGPWNSFFFFSDPDGNGWAVQEKPTTN
jgi:hypothetical protein